MSLAADHDLIEPSIGRPASAGGVGRGVGSDTRPTPKTDPSARRQPRSGRSNPLAMLMAESGTADPVAVRRFAIAVRRAGSQGLLTWSERQKLTAYALTLGIRPFDASLLIAAVHGREQDRYEASSHRRPATRTSARLGEPATPANPKRGLSATSLTVLAVLAQGILASAAWFLMG